MRVQLKYQNKPSGYWKDIKNQRYALGRVAATLKIFHARNWYNVTKDTLVRTGAASVLKYYNYSVSRCLQAVYPDVTWNIENFRHTPRKYLHSKYNQRKTFDFIAQKLNLVDLDAWYSVTVADIHKHGGGAILQLYGNSLSQGLQSLYPESEWHPWKFKQSPTGYWQDIRNQRRALDALGHKLNVKELDGWYKISHLEMASGLGGVLVHYYDNSVLKCLKALYPQKEWKYWLFKGTPRGYNGDLQTQRETFNDIAERMDIKELDDWYSIRASSLPEFRGAGILSNLYGDSLSECLETLYPNHDWKLWFFGRAPTQYWNVNNLKRLVFDISNILKIKDAGDWSTISPATLKDMNMTFALHALTRFGSVEKTLEVLFPNAIWDQEFDVLWQESVSTKKHTSSFRSKRQKRVIPNAKFWLKQENPLRFLKNVQKRLRITEPSMWYHVSLGQLENFVGGSGIVRYCWPHALRLVEPNFPWVWQRFDNTISKQAQQRLLYRRIKTIFPESQVRQEATIDLSENRQWIVSVDILVPFYNIAIEYQGQQHYDDVYAWHSSEKQKILDAQKSQQCADVGVRLVPIPYWWRGDTASLLATLNYYCPDLQLYVPVGAKPLLDELQSESESGDSRLMKPTEILLFNKCMT